ncbi:MAG: transposase [Cenarchaeum sp. SB0665_bin_23]|nr:transposase [Cenarchaeum sp. SB0665_bin_23]MYB46862.1 transposase [Cenarchaeum sp. SB0662_bin_33]MYG33589.1 transposase [Cenarchaeum sp. SB0677_bin_16]
MRFLPKLGDVTPPPCGIVCQPSCSSNPVCVVYNVHKGDKKLADIVEETVELGSRVYTDEYEAYSSLGKRGYEHETANHSEGEYASGEDNKIHTNESALLFE